MNKKEDFQQEAVDEVKAAVDALRQELTQVESTVASARTQAANNAKMLTANKQWVQENMVQIKSTTQAVQQAEEVQAEMKEWLKKNEAGIMENTKALEAHKQVMDQNRVWIQQNVDAVENNKKSIEEVLAHT